MCSLRCDPYNVGYQASPDNISIMHFSHHRQRRQQVVEAIAISAVVLLIVGGGVLTYRGFTQLQQNRERVRHTNKVLLALEATESVMKDAETGQRGFIITGRELYLEPFDAAMSQIDEVLRELDALTVDNPVQQAKLPKLRELVAERLAELRFAIAIRHEDELEAAKAAVDTDIGKHTMDAIRDHLAEMTAIERDRLVERERIALQSYRAGRWTTILLTLAGLLLVGGMLYLIENNRRLDTQMRWFLEQIQDYAIFTMDANCRATSWNHGVEQVLGYSRGEFIGQDIIPLLFPPDAIENASAAEEFKTAQREGVANDDRWMLRKGNKRFWASGTTNSIVNDRGTLVGFSKVVRDLTDRKRAQDELADLAAKLSEADRRKDEFLATLAHELRNPLAPIKNAVQLMGMYRLDDEIEELRQTMDRQTDQMVHLIDDLLDVSRISRGKIEMQNEIVDLHQVIETSVEASSSLIVENCQELRVESDADVVFINADSRRITQVISNLLTNASKYSNADCKIALSVDTQQTPGGEWAVIRVRDNGIGIAADKLNAIFQMFSQVNDTLERGAAGLGIGLTLVKTLVELHGGEVWAESEGEGHGSLFTVRLPRAERPERAASDEREPESLTTRAFRVLVVEDQLALRVVLTRLLEKMGHHVETADGGAAALEKLKQYSPEIIFSDISMPGMTGYELARRLREHEEMRNVIIVAMTGFGQTHDRDQALEAGFNEHLVKPVDARVLQHLFASWVNENENANMA